MKALLTHDFAISKVVNLLKDQFKIVLTGSLAQRDGSSYNDIDLVMIYKSGAEITQFRNALVELGWTLAVDKQYRNDSDNGEVWTNKMVVTANSSPNNVYEVQLEIYYEQDFGGERVLDDDRFK